MLQFIYESRKNKIKKSGGVLKKSGGVFNNKSSVHLYHRNGYPWLFYLYDPKI